MNTPLTNQFKNVGYLHLKNSIPSGLIASTTQALLHLYETKRDSSQDTLKWGYRHGVSLEPMLWELVRSRAIAESVRDALGARQLAYLEDSDLKVWERQPASGWHRDSMSPRFGQGTEWGVDGRYQIARIALYLQPESDAFEWGCIPGSHVRERLATAWERLFWPRVLPVRERAVSSRLNEIKPFRDRLWIRSDRWKLLPLPPTEPVWIRTAPGDIVVFDPRLIHVGGHVPYRKWAVFFSMGAKNEHSRYHRDYFGGAQLDAAGGDGRKKFLDMLRSEHLSFE
jgi:hypothetical protein